LEDSSLTCPLKTDPTFMLGLVKGDRSKCRGKAKPSNRSSAHYEKRKYFSVRNMLLGIGQNRLLIELFSLIDPVDATHKYNKSD
jgi:hypothetical protein